MVGVRNGFFRESSHYFGSKVKYIFARFYLYIYYIYVLERVYASVASAVDFHERFSNDLFLKQEKKRGQRKGQNR